jgi:hypothetical protein
MLARKPPEFAIDVTHRKQLEYLYARRSNVDALIESLRKYDRFLTPPPDRKRPPA